MIDVKSETILKLKENYKQIFPLIVHRSMERGKSPGDLFDILSRLWKSIEENKDKAWPIVWSEEGHEWVKTDDLFQSSNFVNKQKEQK